MLLILILNIRGAEPPLPEKKNNHIFYFQENAPAFQRTRRFS